MTKELRDPSLPPGAVVEVREDGSALRNDGVELKPAGQNPWYVLATVYGEQTGEEIDYDLAARNRRIWNGWSCSEMDEDARAALAERLKLDAADLASLTEVEWGDVKAAFSDRLPPEAKIPEPKDAVKLGDSYFSHTLVWEKYVCSGNADFTSVTFSGTAKFRSATFSGDAYFDSTTFSGVAYFDSTTFSGDAFFGSATFGGYAVFGSATFSGDAYFESTTFSGSASFRSATFGGYAVFGSATFSGDAFFGSATFGGDAYFESATFSGPAWFGSATFSGVANFSNEKFAAATSYAGARFRGAVPRFYERAFHQDTEITIRPENWPGITPENAEESKRAYTRLRQVMNGLHKPDAEHFFGRQEMRCDAYLGGGTFRTLSRGYELVSDYGYSVFRPAAWLTGLIAVCWGILGSYLKHGKGVEGVAAIWQGLGLSIANTFPYLGFQRLYFGTEFSAELAPWVKVLGGVQTVLGGALLFFLLLGLRNRFRLK